MKPDLAKESVRSCASGPEASVAAQAKERFCAEMSNGLHAIAQPLTVLRTAISAATLPGGTPEQQRLYIDISRDQVERACTLFQWLQQLVTAHEVEADRELMNVAEMLAPVVEAEREGLAPAGVTIKAEIPEDLQPVIGDMDRTLEALFAALKIAGSISSSGDVIDLSVASSQDGVAMTVRNPRMHQKRVNSSDRLSLALAEANIRSQGGHFTCVEDPFSVSFTLPVQRGGGADASPRSDIGDAHTLQVVSDLHVAQ